MHQPRSLREPGDLIVRAARACIGTRWHHQGRVKGAGLDCVGLLVHAFGEALAEPFPDSTDYGRVHDNGRLVRELDARLDRVAVSDLRPGDVVAFTWTESAVESQHVAIVTQSEPLRIIHANARQRGVVEHDAGAYWSSKISAAFRARSLA